MQVHLERAGPRRATQPLGSGALPLNLEPGLRPCAAAACPPFPTLPSPPLPPSPGHLPTLLCRVVSALSFGPSSIVALVPSAEDWCIGEGGGRAAGGTCACCIAGCRG